MNISAEAWVALVLGALGFLGTTGTLIMNLSIRSAMRAGDLKIEQAVSVSRAEAAREAAELKVEMANLRTKVAEGQAGMYEKIMDNLQRTYMNRDVSQSMHAANTQRLDQIEKRLVSIEERLPA